MNHQKPVGDRSCSRMVFSLYNCTCYKLNMSPFLTCAILICIILPFFNHSLAEHNSSRLFTLGELRKYAQDIVRIQVAGDNLSSLHSELLDTMRKSNKENARRFLFDSIDDRVRIFTIVQLDSNLFWDNLVIFNGQEVATSKKYVFAMEYNGSFYYLHGFGTTQWDLLIQNKIAPISSSEEALALACLYTQVESIKDITSETMIEKHNFSKYSKSYSPSLPVVEASDEGWVVRYMTAEYKIVETMPVGFSYFENTCSIKHDGTIANIRKRVK